MKKNILITLGAVVILIGAILFAGNPERPQALNPAVQKALSDMEAATSSPGEFAPPDPLTDSNTALYENKELGFSVRYPKALVSRHNDGTIESSRKISIFSDAKGSDAFIIAPVYGGTATMPDTLEKVLALPSEQRDLLDMWGIHFTDVRPGESKTDMANRIFNYPDFKYRNLKNSDMAGNDPSIYYGGGEGFVVIKESPFGKRAAIWSFGDNTFGTYDSYMIDSFEVSDK